MRNPSRSFLPFVVFLWAGCSAPPPTRTVRTQSVRLERELKLVLTRRGYETLLQHFSKSTPVGTAVQRNYYFDTADFLVKRNGVNIRLRKKGKATIFTLKVGEPDWELVPVKGRKALRERQEYECRTEKEGELPHILKGQARITEVCSRWSNVDPKARHPVEVLKELLARGFVTQGGSKISLREEDLRCVARNETTRTAIPATFAGHSLTLELDKTMFPRGYVGYELELEVPSSEGAPAVLAALKEFLSELGVDFAPSAAGKTKITFMIIENKPGVVNGLLREGIIHKVPHSSRRSQLPSKREGGRKRHRARLLYEARHFGSLVSTRALLSP